MHIYDEIQRSLLTFYFEIVFDPKE